MANSNLEKTALQKNNNQKVWMLSISGRGMDPHAAPQDLWFPGKNEGEVIGPICLLAKIKSEGNGEAADIELQRVLSWHLREFLEVVVTTTTSKAEELFARYCGDKEYQFLSLENSKESAQIEVNLKDLSSMGDPVYVRSILEFSRDNEEEAARAYSYVLGNVILIDDLDSAINFMKTFNGKGEMACPPILTRDGYKLDEHAIVGGQNSVPPNWGEEPL